MAYDLDMDQVMVRHVHRVLEFRLAESGWFRPSFQKG